MNSKYKKLELCWPGKDIEVKPEPRVLIEDAEKSYGVAVRVNMVRHAANRLALKALEQSFSGKIKCIYIDPPYNTGNAFEHYDDGLEHSTWLNLMKPRLELLYRLLSNDGSIWISIDDDESNYLKVLCDEIFGRRNFIANVLWQKRTSPDNRLKLGPAHDHILVYGRIPLIHKNFNQLEISTTRKKDFKNPDNDPHGPWASTDCTAQAGHGTSNQFYSLTTPTGRVINLPDNLCWRFTKERMDEEIKAGRIWFGKDGKGVPRKKTYLSEIQGQNSWTWWENSEVGHNQEAKKEIIALFGGNNTFDTPKPERLIQRVIQIATNEGDLVLDSFLGSGTTSAVAHKMGRKWIGIELGNHANTHCLPRLRAVCDGTDQGGISEAMEWKGGGGFKFYNLAPSLLNQDKYNQWIINPNYNADLLAAAMARQEGFTYSPDESVVWKQGFATENHFIFTTTNTITADVVEQILSEMKPDESLRICCTAFMEGCNEISNRIEIKKIPEVLLGKCEFGKEDYCTDTNIINMPADPDKPAFTPSYVKPDVKPEPAKIKKDKPTQTKLLF